MREFSAGAVEYPSIQKTVMENRWTLQLHRLSDHKAARNRERL